MRRKYEGLRICDLRRSAARDLRKAKASEDVAMKITGHTVASNFHTLRHFTDGEDVRDALIQVGQYKAGSIRESENNARRCSFRASKSVTH
jgi:hypothetical protein